MPFIVGGLVAFLLVAIIAVWRSSTDTVLPSDKKSVKNNPVGAILGDKKSEDILEAVSDGIVVIDRKGRITKINEAAGLLAGWTPKDAQGIDHRSVLVFCNDKGEPYDDTANPFSKLIRTGKPYRDSDATIITKGSNKHVAVSISMSPLIGRGGELDGGVGVIRDVSVEKNAERQRAEFISTASHEMRTPVAAIEGYLALAMNEKVSKIDAKAKNYLQKAHESTQHLGSLFQDLLTSAKAEDGRLISHPELVEMGSFLGKLTEDLRFIAQKKNLEVEFVVGSNGANMESQVEIGSIRVVQPIYYVYADPDRLREVITNLFDNAVKYSDSGKVSLGLTGDEAVVQMYVRDSGSGIAAEDIPHLFQKFYRVDNTATRTIGGTGLGLFICRKIVELYNGRIWVESEPGKGSTFYINLPRVNRQSVKELQSKGASGATLTLGGDDNQ